ncbi:MAG: hypothetical protein Q9202_006628 [Teloschistes flavicans]
MSLIYLPNVQGPRVESLDIPYELLPYGLLRRDVSDIDAAYRSFGEVFNNIWYTHLRNVVVAFYDECGPAPSTTEFIEEQVGKFLDAWANEYKPFEQYRRGGWRLEYSFVHPRTGELQGLYVNDWDQEYYRTLDRDLLRDEYAKRVRQWHVKEYLLDYQRECIRKLQKRALRSEQRRRRRMDARRASRR